MSVSVIVFGLIAIVAWFVFSIFQLVYFMERRRKRAETVDIKFYVIEQDVAVFRGRIEDIHRELNSITDRLHRIETGRKPK